MTLGSDSHQATNKQKKSTDKQEKHSEIENEGSTILFSTVYAARYCNHSTCQTRTQLTPNPSPTRPIPPNPNPKLFGQPDPNSIGFGSGSGSGSGPERTPLLYTIVRPRRVVETQGTRSKKVQISRCVHHGHDGNCDTRSKALLCIGILKHNVNIHIHNKQFLFRSVHAHVQRYTLYIQRQAIFWPVKSIVRLEEHFPICDSTTDLILTCDTMRNNA